MTWQGDAAIAVLSWLLTYLVHSTALLGGAVVLSLVLRRRAEWVDVLWKVALVGGLASATLQAALARAAGGIDSAIAVGAATQSGAVSGPIAPEVAEGGRGAALKVTTERVGASSPALDGSAAMPQQRGRSSAAVLHVRPPGGAAVLVLGWLVIAGALVARVFVRRRHMFALLGRRSAVEAGPAADAFASAASSAGLGRGVRLTVANGCPVPLALSTREVCVPARFLTGLDAEQQAGALAHEVAHLARRDPAWLFFAQLLEAVFFFQPLQVLARRRLKETAEYVCDAWAARAGGALGLARCLASVAEWIGSRDRLPAATTAMTEPGSPLVRRIERLLAPRARNAASRWPGVVCAGVLLASVTGAAPSVALSGAGSERGRSVVSDRGEAEAAGESHAAVEGKVEGDAPRSAPTRAQEPVVRAPRFSDPLAERWRWALARADADGERGFWVVYAFARPMPAGHHYLSDSEGIHIPRDIERTPSLEQMLPDAGDANIALMFHFRGGAGEAAIDRIGHRTTALGMRFGSETVYWLGPAQDAESVAHLERLFGELSAEPLAEEVVDAAALHATSAIVLPFLDRLLSGDPREVIRAEAAEGLEHHPNAEALRMAVTAARRDAATRVRQEAAEAIGELQTAGAAEALADLVMSSPDARVRAEAAEGLGSQPADVALPVIERVIFAVDDPVAAEEAVEAVADLKDQRGVQLLGRVAREHPSSRVRREAVETLPELGGPGVIDALAELLRGGADEAVQEEVLDALAEIDSPAARALLLEAAESGAAARTRREAVETLTDEDHLDARSREELTELGELLERTAFGDADRGVMRAAVESLGNLPASVARPILRRIIEEHPDSSIRKEAVELLSELGRG